MTYAPPAYVAPPRPTYAAPARVRRRRLRAAWRWWSRPSTSAQVRHTGYVIAWFATVLLAFVAGIVWAVVNYDGLTTVQAAVAL